MGCLNFQFAQEAGVERGEVTLTFAFNAHQDERLEHRLTQTHAANAQ